MKIVIQGLITLFIFAASWFALSQVNWVKLFKIEKLTHHTEDKLGKLFWDFFKTTDKEITSPFVVRTVDSLVDKICEGNHLDRKKIMVHVLQKEEINAFALPGGHLVVYSGLIAASDNPEELCGVMCHEIAHIQLNHVMKKLITEVGLSALIALTTGGRGTETLSSIAKTLSSTAFDRNLEKEADITGVSYLLNANIKYEPFANFLYKLSAKENESMKYLTWMSTHPDSKARAEYILDYGKGKQTKTEAVISSETWTKLKGYTVIEE